MPGRGVSDQPVLQARLHASLAETLHALGLYVAATPPSERAIELRRRHLGDDHPDTLASLEFRGILLEYRERWADAEPVYREVVRRRRRLQGDDAEETLASISRLAFVLMALDEQEEGEALYREHTAALQRGLGDDDPSLVTAAAGRLWRERRFAEAEPYFRRMMEDGRQREPGGSETTATLEFNLANVLVQIGKLPEAEQLYASALATLRTCCGDTHSTTLKMMRCLGDTLQRQDKLDEAERVLTEALETTRLVKGDRTDAAAEARMALADVLARLERYDKAETLLLEAVEPDATGPAVEQIVRLYEAWGKADEAAQWRERLP